MKILIIFTISLISLSSMGQDIERKTMNYSINDVQVVRRYRTSIIYQKPEAVSDIILYSDSIGTFRQTMCLLIKFYNDIPYDSSFYIEFVYEDGEKERVPILRDKRSAYCFIERSKRGYAKSICYINIGGIGEIVMFPETVMAFAKNLGIRYDFFISPLIPCLYMYDK